MRWTERWLYQNGTTGSIRPPRAWCVPCGLFTASWHFAFIAFFSFLFESKNLCPHAYFGKAQAEGLSTAEPQVFFTRFGIRASRTTLRMAPKKATAQKQTAKAKAKRAQPLQRKKPAAKSMKMPRAVPLWPVPVASRSGVATAYPQETRLELNTFTNKDQLFFFGLDGQTATYGCCFTRTEGAAALACTVYNLPCIDGSGVTSSTTLYPTSGRAMTFEFKMLNATPLVNVGGRVYFLRCDQRLSIFAAPSALSGTAASTDPTSFNALVNTITGSQNIEPHTHSEFANVREKDIPFEVSRVIDRVTYDTFEPWTAPHPNTAAGADAYMKEHAMWPGQPGNKRAMAGYAVYLPRTTQPQDLTIIIRASHYFRWPLQSIGAALHKEIPVAKDASKLPDAPKMPAAKAVVR